MSKCKCRRVVLPSLFDRFARDESGATAIEYGLIVSLIFLAIVAAVNDFAGKSNDMYSDIQSALTN
ncbi:MAG: Flp family type IVb pilin [Pseudomonadota bacterium]